MEVRAEFPPVIEFACAHLPYETRYAKILSLMIVYDISPATVLAGPLIREIFSDASAEKQFLASQRKYSRCEGDATR